MDNVGVSMEGPVENDCKEGKMPTNTQQVEGSLGQDEKVSEMAKLTKQNSQLKESLDNTQQQLEELKSTSDGKIQDLQKQLEDKSELESQIKELQEQLASKDNELGQALNAKTQALERTQAQLEKLRKDSDAKTKEFEGAKAQLERERNSVKQELDKITEELRRKEADLENSKKELDNVNEKVSKLEHETLNQQVSINDLTKERDQLASEANTLKQAVQDVDTLNDKIVQLTKQNSQLEKQLRKELNNVTEKLTQEQQKAFKLGDQVTTLTKELDETKAQLEGNGRELDGAKKSVLRLTNDLRQEKLNQQVTVNNLNSEITQLTNEKGLLAEQLNGTQQSSNKGKKLSAVSAQSRKQITYASVSFVLSGTLAVGASLTIPYLAICIVLAVAASIFLAVGCYCSYKANTALSNVEIDQIENGVDHVAAGV